MPRAEKQKKARAPASCVTGSEVIRLYVGKAGPYVIHEALASHHSEYFRRMFASNAFKESKTKEVHWDDEEVDVVELMVKWFYFQFIDLGDLYARRNGDGSTRESEASGSAKSTPDRGHDSNILLVVFKLWVLAEKRGVSALRNSAVTLCHKHIVDARAEKSEYPIRLEDAVWLFENTSEDATIRSFVVDCLTLTGDVQTFNLGCHEVSTSLQSHLIRRMAFYYTAYPSVTLRMTEFDKLQVCDYHEHSSGYDCRGKTIAPKLKVYLKDTGLDFAAPDMTPEVNT